jgi:hypothetical protein
MASPVGGLLIAESRVPRALPGPPPTQPTGYVAVDAAVSLDPGDRPAEAGQLAGGGDGDDRAALRPGFQPRPGAVQASLRTARDRDRFGGWASWRSESAVPIAGRLR